MPDPRPLRPPSRRGALHLAARRSLDRQGARPARRRFVVSDDGIIESAGRYFESSLADIELQLGLGARRIAAASITRATTAIAIVVSESSVVRVFHDGRLATEILPELWLLRRFIPHLHNPQLTERRDENLVVFGESDDTTPDDGT